MSNNEIYEIIKEKSKNIGSLCSYLNNPINIEYLNIINSNIPDIDLSLSEKIWYFINNISDIQRCNCGDKLSFIGFKNGYRKSCGKKECFVKNRRQTCIETYGVDNPKKSAIIIEKEKKGILEKYNGKHYMLDSKIIEKFKNTMISNHGVEWAQQSKTINNKSKQSFNDNPNREDIIQRRKYTLVNKTDNEKKDINKKKVKSIVEKFGSYNNFVKYRSLKIEESSLYKFGETHHFKSIDIINKRVESYARNITNKIISKLPKSLEYIDRKYNTNSTDSYIELKCNNCLTNFNITRQFLVSRISSMSEVCLICNPKLSGTSKKELEVYEFVKSLNNSTINRYKINNTEIDIYLPDLKIGFEFNGLYWHSEEYKSSTYHLDKTKECLEQVIQLIHIWEDDWTYKQDIVKSMILNKLGKSDRIFARKCEIKEISDNKLIRDFLDSNHIQGFVGSKVKLGLYFNDELVSLMTFGNLRKSLGQKSKEGSYELLRFCNKLNTSVVGGASKLFKYFTDNYDVKEVISYSDLSRSNGNMYQQLGFKLLHNSDPNYYYVIDDIRKHRFNFRKDKLVSEGYDPNKTEIEIMSERGYHRIFDCGMQKWGYVSN